jgi:UPF0755 protein
VEEDEEKSDDSSYHHGDLEKIGGIGMAKMSVTTVQKLNKMIWTSVRVIAKVVVFLFLLIMLLTAISKGYQLGYNTFAGSAMSSEPGRTVIFVVKEGQSVSTVGRALENAGLIEDSNVFWLQQMFYEYELKPGTYRLSTAMTTKEIWQALQSTSIGEEEETETEK